MPKPPQVQPQAEPDATDKLLLDLAAALLTDYFFDPDNESRYLKLYPSRRATGDDVLLVEETRQLNTLAWSWRLDVLRRKDGFRILVWHPEFTASVEGTWRFRQETLRPARVVLRTGSQAAIASAVEALVDDIVGFDPSDEEFQDLMAALVEETDAPLVGDNPEEPPPATSAERARVKALAMRLARKANGEMRIEDRTWLEMTPQTLPVITDLVVEAMTGAPRNDALVAASLMLAGLQLEFVRYRLDRGWEWAERMLDGYQQRLITLGQAGTLAQEDWFAMAAALTEARVPVSETIQTKLAEAGMATPSAEPPQEMLAALRALSDEMARMVGSPFEVVESFRSAAAVMPPALRSFMATELALSSHDVLREAVPMMLLDPDSSVRRAAGAAMEQTAAPERVSPDWLRRAITARNWIPQPDRAELDRAIRKARAVGVPIGSWPAEPDLAFHATMVDGGGAQSILAISRTGRKGIVAGLLLKHGMGLQDAWIDPAMSRGKINAMLRDMQREVTSDQVDKAYVDAVVQHAIATGLTREVVPPEALLEIAEQTGGAEWKDRRLDVTAEADRMFAALDAEDRALAGIEAGLRRGADWMRKEPIATSWFEDGAEIRRTLAKVPRKDNVGARRLVLTEILPASRMIWAERFLLMAMWSQASASLLHRNWSRDFVILTHALTRTGPLEAIPAMQNIAAQTVMAARSSGW